MTGTAAREDAATPDLLDAEPLIARGTTCLRRLGLRAEERVAVLLDNDPTTFGVLAAACLEGIVPVPLPGDLGGPEADEILADAAPVAVVATPERARRLAARHGRRGPRRRTPPPSAGPLLHAVTPDDLRALPPTDPSASWPRTRPMAYTSGTTGRRKGVHVGVHDAAWGEEVVADEHAAFDRRHGDRHLVVSPLYHSGPFRFALVSALLGGRIAVLPRFDAAAWSQALRTLRPTSLFCVPTQLHRLAAGSDDLTEDLASLDLLAHAGAPCPVPLKERVLRAAPDGAVWEFYGATEGQFTTCPPADWTAAPGTVGRARPGRRLVVRRDDGSVAPSGEVGTVWAHVPDHARFSYWRDPARTTAAWDGDAFTVGDLGHLDDAGRLFLAGRPGDLVITGGVNVYPAEVERFLLGVPGVAEAAVFGVPDDDWGQRLVAAVVPWPGAELDAATVRATLARQLGRAKVPKDVLVVAELPRTPTGKVRRAGNALVELWRSGA
ncbi:class I adenylate-forming enzyme family protein [Egicoccus halophilus]|uniref:Acyl-CoA synthetase n=1 Tax=Egicoccus halophilus TaxID=1670830 RepID=A0A8J3A8Z2_9ACTN|nr:AMP-binding protein [Egicoccus halophilus]GGI04637.1 acyl-CoA synthetase [Egicoccus halophilus]